MLNIFTIDNKKLIQVDCNYNNDSKVDANNQNISEIDYYESIFKDAFWVDIIEGTPQERNVIDNASSFNFVKTSNNGEMKDIEASARYYEDEDGLHLHSFFYYEDNVDHDYANLSTVSFNIKDGKLLSLRNEDLSEFRLFRLRSRYMTFDDNIKPEEIIIHLFEAKIEKLADVIEYINKELDRIGGETLYGVKHNEDFNEMLVDLINLEDSNSKVTSCLTDTQRALSFLRNRINLSEKQREQVLMILRDIDSIKPNTDALFQRINFLLQAAMGLVNIEQNKIIKIFSVVSVIFLPPTLVASIYGMNFHHMPELALKYGYPMALIFMILSAVCPFLFFKFKKWL